MKLFLDDVRPCPDGWVGAVTADDAKYLLRRGTCEAISLDHDLGPPEAGTGYDVLIAIEQRVASDVNYLPPQMLIHSANPVGRERMQAAINKIWEIIDERVAKRKPD